jgi:hypothetical protein
MRIAPVILICSIVDALSGQLVKRLHQIIKFLAGETVLHIQKFSAQGTHFLFDVAILEDDIRDILSQLFKIIFSHPKAGHLLNPGPQ